MGGSWVQILAKDYFIEYTEGSETFCFLAFVPTQDAYWLLGDAFLNGYYSIHDNINHANARLGLVPHATSTKQFPYATDAPTASVLDIQWELTWVYDVYLTFKPVMLFPEVDKEVYKWFSGIVIFFQNILLFFVGLGFSGLLWFFSLFQ